MINHNVLPQSNPLIGRDSEIVEITVLLQDPACHMLTLTGPGGIGKTRLALEVAQMMGRQFVSGFSFVPLQPLTTPEHIPTAIAEALHLQFHPGDKPGSQLVNYLHDQSLLLALDNFEHLIEGVELISDILAGAPDIKLLVTSRERLNLAEEWVYDVRGLSYPTNETATEIESYGAVQLFVQNARRVQHSFKLTQPHTFAVARICRMVDGMPLGIELASAWVRALPCEAIADEIQRSLDILETPVRNIPPRHRTMRAAFEPTWNRLTEAEREAFMRLSVFRGGFRQEAAHRVAATSPQMLSALVDKSLLRVDAAGRYDIHELLRQYGEEQLNTLPEVYQQTLDLHRAYYMEFLAEREIELVFLGQQKRAIEKINHELQNVRLAWRQAVEQGCLDEIARAADGLWNFY